MARRPTKPHGTNKHREKTWQVPEMNSTARLPAAVAYDLNQFFNTNKDFHGFPTMGKLFNALIRSYLQAARAEIPGESEPSYEKYALKWSELINPVDERDYPGPDKIMKRMLAESAVPTMEKLPLSERPRLQGHFTKEYMERIDRENYTRTDYLLDLIWIPEMCGGFANGFFDGEEEWNEHIQQYLEKGYGKMWFPYNDRGFMSNWQNGDQLAHEGVFMDDGILDDTGNAELAWLMHDRIGDWEKIWPRYRDKDPNFVDQERVFLETVRDSEERKRIVSNRDMSLEEIEEIVGVKRSIEGEDSA